MANNQADGALVNGGLVVKPVAFKQGAARIGPMQPEIYHRRRGLGTHKALVVQPLPITGE